MSFWLENKGLARRTNEISPILHLGTLPYFLSSDSGSIYTIQIRERTCLKKKKITNFRQAPVSSVIQRVRFVICSSSTRLSKSGHINSFVLFFLRHSIEFPLLPESKLQSHPQSLNWHFPWGPGLQLHLIFQSLNLFKFKVSTYSPGIKGSSSPVWFPQPLFSSLSLERVRISQHDQLTLCISLCSLLLEQALGVENWLHSDNKAGGQESWEGGLSWRHWVTCGQGSWECGLSWRCWVTRLACSHTYSSTLIVAFTSCRTAPKDSTQPPTCKSMRKRTVAVVMLITITALVRTGYLWTEAYFWFLSSGSKVVHMVHTG